MNKLKEDEEGEGMRQKRMTGLKEKVEEGGEGMGLKRRKGWMG